jgi:subtilisin family serine protease
VWAILKSQADLSQAANIHDWNRRGRYVYEQLVNAAKGQTRLHGWLAGRGAAHRGFWIVNAIRAEADQDTIDALKAHPDVASVVEDHTYQLQPITPLDQSSGGGVVQWGLNDIGARDVWSTMGDRGDGIVVGSLDTGVEYDHPALKRQYRGNLGNGTYDHNYNWFDPSNACGTPSLAPCDDVSHGTHTVGTMVGDDGDPGPNQIGVAPHAKWIAAKGCVPGGCSDSDLLAAGEWMLAPTDLQNQNPRPDLRPNIVNNSWGGDPTDTFFEATVQAWVAAGIFPAFAAGNSGPGCGTALAPGDYPESFAVAAYDITDTIAYFSSRGVSPLGPTKPDIAAPGLNIVSSVPPYIYAVYSGTSMATPHVSGSVALIWSAVPSLVGDVATTRSILTQSALPVSDVTCGGTASYNDVWGSGRLNAFAAVALAKGTPTGVVKGKVSASIGDASYAKVHLTGPMTTDLVTDLYGNYQAVLLAGTYTVTASQAYFQDATLTGQVVAANSTTVLNIPLGGFKPQFALSGVVSDAAGHPMVGATVSMAGEPALDYATTDQNGLYSFSNLPSGQFNVNVVATDRCLASKTIPLSFTSAGTLDFALQPRFDDFGYSCASVAPAYIGSSTPLTMTGTGDSASVTLPFSFPFYGLTYTTADVVADGHLSFPSVGVSMLPAWYSYVSPIPNPNAPNAAIYPYWSTNYPQLDSTVTADLVAGQYVIDWNDSVVYSNVDEGGVEHINIEAALSPDGTVLVQYGTSDGPPAMGGTVGIEDPTGTLAFQYAYNENADGKAVRFLPPLKGPYFADVNGDGLADMIVASNSSLMVGLSNGTSFATPTLWGRTSLINIYTAQLLFADVDGDGKADALVISPLGARVYKSTGTRFGTSALNWGSFTPAVRGTFLADVTGDGKADLIMAGDNDIQVAVSTGSTFSASTSWSGRIGANGVYVGDVDGDGKRDLVTIGGGVAAVSLSTGSAFASPATWWGQSTALNAPQGAYLADVDADGRADLIAINGSQVDVLRSTGSGFTTYTSWGTGSVGSRSTFAIDVTGDHRADLIVAGGTTVQTSASTGSAFNSSVTWYSGSF